MLDKNKVIKKKPAKAEEPNNIVNAEASTLEQWWENQQAAAVAAVAMVEEEEKVLGLRKECEEQDRLDMNKMRTELERHEALQIYKELLDIEKGKRRKKGHAITIVDDEMEQQE
eukprot:6173205-Heterocapsa_arctica.AAC.1